MGIWFDGIEIFVGLGYCNACVFYFVVVIFLGAATVLIFKHSVFFIVVLRVSTHIVLSLFPCFLAPLFYVFVLYIISWLKNTKKIILILHYFKVFSYTTFVFGEVAERLLTL